MVSNEPFASSNNFNSSHYKNTNFPKITNFLCSEGFCPPFSFFIVRWLRNIVPSSFLSTHPTGQYISHLFFCQPYSHNFYSYFLLPVLDTVLLPSFHSVEIGTLSLSHLTDTILHRVQKYHPSEMCFMGLLKLMGQEEQCRGAVAVLFLQFPRKSIRNSVSQILTLHTI